MKGSQIFGENASPFPDSIFKPHHQNYSRYFVLSLISFSKTPTYEIIDNTPPRRRSLPTLQELGKTAKPAKLPECATRIEILILNPGHKCQNDHGEPSHPLRTPSIRTVQWGQSGHYGAQARSQSSWAWYYVFSYSSSSFRPRVPTPGHQRHEKRAQHRILSLPRHHPSAKEMRNPRQESEYRLQLYITT